MANWITHMMIVDRLLDMGIDVDIRGFAVGNVAPDCNVENADWSEFTPPREVTHWMRGRYKDSADYEGFYDKYIRGRAFASREEEAFFLGYYSHLIADAEFQRFFQSPGIVAARFSRLREHPEYYRRVAGMPETHDTIRRAFTRREKLGDLIDIERGYLKRRPDSAYNTVLRSVAEFPDYIDYLPPGAIARKIPVMLASDDRAEGSGGQIFITDEEHGGYIARASEMIYDNLQKMMRGRRER